MSNVRLLAGRPMSRRAFMQRAAAAGVGLSALGALMASCADDDGPDRPLTPAFYDWILSLFPTQAVSDSWDQEVNVQTAPVEGFGIERFVAEGEEGESTWDIYVGMTPFVEMAALIDAGVIEPWDDYLADGVADTWVPSVRAEATYDGSIYSHPFDTSIVAAGWHGGLVEAAGLDPDHAPATWDEWITSARQVMDSGAAPFGATFDANGWRSLAPVSHSIDNNVYTEEGRFDFTHDAVVEALEIMRRLMEVSNPDVLGQGATDAGANVTPDEGAFAGEKAAYYFKHALRTDQHVVQVGRSQQPAARGHPDRAGRVGRNGVLVDRRRSVHLRRQQGAGCGVHALPHHQRGHPPGRCRQPGWRGRPAPALRNDLGGVAGQPAILAGELGDHPEGPAQQGECHPDPHGGSDPVPDRPAPLGDLPDRRGVGPAPGSAGRQGRGTGRDFIGVCRQSDSPCPACHRRPSRRSASSTYRCGYAFVGGPGEKRCCRRTTHRHFADRPQRTDPCRWWTR